MLDLDISDWTQSHEAEQAQITFIVLFLAFHFHHLIAMLVRLHYAGSNRGDCIYGVSMPSFDGDKVWKMFLDLLEVKLDLGWVGLEFLDF